MKFTIIKKIFSVLNVTKHVALVHDLNCVIKIVEGIFPFIIFPFYSPNKILKNSDRQVAISKEINFVKYEPGYLK